MMKLLSTAALATFALTGGALAQTASTGTAKAQATVSNLPGDGAVKADTQKKPDPSGQKASEYKPPQKPLTIKEPPAKPK